MLGSLEGSLVYGIAYMLHSVILPVVLHTLPKEFESSKATIGLTASSLFVCSFLLIQESDAQFRAITINASLWSMVRIQELLRQERFKHMGIWKKVAHSGSIFHDVTQCQEERRTVGQLILRIIGIGLCSGISYVIIWILKNRLVLAEEISMILTFPMLTVRNIEYILGTVFGAINFMMGLYTLNSILSLIAFLAFGLKIPPLMRHPFFSTSLKDFWGVRWNTAVQLALKTYIYTPMRKVHGFSHASALFATFFVSGLYHVIPVLAAGQDSEACISMMLYFLLQAIFMGVEDLFSIGKMPNAVGHLWTALATIGPSPLLLDPVFHMLGTRL